MSKKKSVVSSQSPVEKPLTIIVTVLPPKRGSRVMIVSAAREGEMPLVLGGAFADRHHLLDQAYATVMKREPQVVTVKDATSKHGKVSADQIRNDGSKDEEETEKVVADIDTARDSDQLVEGDGSGEALPAIEGDDVAGTQELSDISSPEESDAEETATGAEVDDDR